MKILKVMFEVDGAHFSLTLNARGRPFVEFKGGIDDWGEGVADAKQLNNAIFDCRSIECALEELGLI
jgi:hypothetical protein